MESALNERQPVALSDTEKQKILYEWNHQPLFEDLELGSECIHELVRAHAQKQPTRIAVTSQQDQYTYQQLENYSNQLAHLLLARGVVSGDRIAVMMERTPSLLLVMLAIFKAGAIYVPINPKYPQDRKDYLLNDSQPKMILARDVQIMPEAFLNSILHIDEKLTCLHSVSPQAIEKNVSLHANAYIIYTSGSTGAPKGVLIKHKSILNLVRWYQRYFNVSDVDHASQFASQSFDTFFCETLPYIASGACVHMIEEEIKLIPNLFFSWLQQHKITICDLPTAYAQVLFPLKWPENGSLRILKIGGEGLPRYPTQRFSFELWNTYGPTECTVETTFIRLAAANEAPESAKKQYQVPPIGRPLTHAQVYVVDQHMQPVPVGAPGELLIGGIGVAAGYWQRETLTQEKFIPHPFSTDPNAKVYKTGDIVRWLANGQLEFVGRIDNQVKVRGFRVELNEIEVTLSKYPDVREVVVLSTEVAAGQKSLTAYVVPNIDKVRLPFQEKCMLALHDNTCIELASLDISKEGLLLSGMATALMRGQPVSLYVKLPGQHAGAWLQGKVAWQQGDQLGIQFTLDATQTECVEKSIEFYIATNDYSRLLQDSLAKRNLKKALKKKMPDYMVPSAMMLLEEFPLNFSGKVDKNSLPIPTSNQRQNTVKEGEQPLTDTERKCADYWCELLRLDYVHVHDNFFVIGGDSLLLSQLSLWVFNEFHLAQFPSSLYLDGLTITALATYIDTQQMSCVAPEVAAEVRADSILADAVQRPKQGHTQVTAPGTILLTGVTGFLGIHLLNELLAAGHTNIICLIRASGAQSPQQRVQNNITKYSLNEIDLKNPAITLVVGDVSAPQFGLSAEAYQRLAADVAVIYHAAAQVNMMATYAKMRLDNVLGTLEVIHFAATGRSKDIHYVSTLSAISTVDANGCYVEDFPTAEPNGLSGGYALSKWVAERLLAQAQARGFPVTIYRLGNVLGQHDTGITNLNDALLLLIKGCIQLGKAPRLENSRVTFTPVDWSARAIAQLSLQAASLGQVFNFEHPLGIQWRDLVKWLNQSGYTLQQVDYQEWLRTLLQASKDNALFPLLAQFLEPDFQKKWDAFNQVRIEKTVAHLARIDIHFPEIETMLLNTYFSYLKKVAFLPDPQSVNAMKQE